MSCVCQSTWQRWCNRTVLELQAFKTALYGPLARRTMLQGIFFFYFLWSPGTEQVRKRSSPRFWDVKNRGNCESCQIHSHRSLQMKDTFPWGKVVLGFHNNPIPMCGKDQEECKTLQMCGRFVQGCVWCYLQLGMARYKESEASIWSGILSCPDLSVSPSWFWVLAGGGGSQVQHLSRTELLF